VPIKIADPPRNCAPRNIPRIQRRIVCFFVISGDATYVVIPTIEKSDCLIARIVRRIAMTAFGRRNPYHVRGTRLRLWAMNAMNVNAVGPMIAAQHQRSIVPRRRCLPSATTSKSQPKLVVIAMPRIKARKESMKLERKRFAAEYE
jgi:hypothetical protein